MASKIIEIGLDGSIQYKRNGDRIDCVIQYINEDFRSATVITPDPRICAGEDIILTILPSVKSQVIKFGGRVIRRTESDKLFKDCRGYLAQILINNISDEDRKSLELIIAQRDAFISTANRFRFKKPIMFSDIMESQEQESAQISDLAANRRLRAVSGFRDPMTEAGRSREPMRTRPPGRYNILLVDDEEPNLNALERTLRREYNVFSATNGRDALAIMEENDIYFIIADQRMPGMTGVEFLERTLENYPNTIRTILTAYTDEQLLMDAINRVHVHRYIKKPWKPEDIIVLVRDTIKTYELEQQKLLDSEVEVTPAR
jgi:CheY-like chemotaxis protein